jgi:hypothetical protein
MEIFVIGLEVLRRFAQRAGPYLLLEAVMPGGTLLALLLYLYRRGGAPRDDGPDEHDALLVVLQRREAIDA